MTRQEFIDKAALRLIATDDAGVKWAYDHAEKLWEEREKRMVKPPTDQQWVDTDNDRSFLVLYGKAGDLKLLIFPSVVDSNNRFISLESSNHTLIEIEVTNLSMEDAKAEAVLLGMSFVHSVQVALGGANGG